MTNDYGNLELHKVLLSAMKDIDKICREHGLRYYLHAGTLLGAMNHKGFIPWDDDVDITLMREDHDRLIEIISQEYADHYFVQTYQTDNEHSNNRTVLKILGTRIVYAHGNNDKLHQEIGIDLVPLYPVPSCRILQKLQQAIIWVLDIAVQIKLGDIPPCHPLTKFIGLLAKRSRGELGRAMDRIMRMSQKKNSKLVGILCYTHRNPYTGRCGYDNENFPRRWYTSPQNIDFEGSLFMTISDPIEYFDRQYGPKWREPYPEEKRVTKHDVKSYTISDEVRNRISL